MLKSIILWLLVICFVLPPALAAVLLFWFVIIAVLGPLLTKHDNY